ncbi:2-hydroxy-3-oxopropionate reductase [Anaerovibrio sp. JC8]|uniref:NAD(P)-dependent oxidoreductase n=1 Tax=Anaerovibrio sp. JC8 TaxID=1240085 RepID=UPI000A0C7594|nr:NAD(P)-dependent oxidoreductase [Anaerovibrio sp. JC8]ORT99826.1 2-hydroxy-3-oxopropionate reductase [Anaerovibrio sp. JC8]
MEIKNIGFIGTGVMGSSMARHLKNAGFNVSVYNRTKSKAQPLVDEGMKWCDTPAEAAKDADVVISIVGYPKDVEEVYLGDEGILSAKKGGIVIDMTTSSPSLAKKIYEAAKAKGVQALDAPVSGGDLGAKNGTLAIMVGGDEGAFNDAQPVFEAMGKTINFFGPAGSGQYTKMANQIAIASGMLGVAEALFYAKKMGLDPQKVLETIETGAAGSWSLSNLGRRMLKEDYAPGFYIKHFLKDMRIAIESAEEAGLELPGLLKTKELYDILSDRGMDDNGTQAIIKWYLNQ